MSLSEFVSETATQEATLTVLNPEQESPIYRLLTRLFNDEAITVQTASTETATSPSDAVLVEKPDAEPAFAVSSTETLRDAVLLVNFDIYVTGARELGDVTLGARG